MSNIVLHRVWKHSRARGAARCLILAIADVADERGVAYPGVEYLAEMINESADHTGRLIDKLIAAGELYKIAGRGRGIKTRFAVLVGLAPEKQNALKGALQNPFSEQKKGASATPLRDEKRGHLEGEKGAILDEKRGHVRNTKYTTFEYAESEQTPIVKKPDPMIQDHDPPPPAGKTTETALGGGGGGFDPEVARLFASYGIKQAEPLARLYASTYPHITLAELRAHCARLDDPTAGQYRGSRLYRVLKLGPPEEVHQPSRSPIPEPTRIAYPDDVLTPQQAADALARLRKKRDEATHAPS